MLPEPKKVAHILKEVFKSKEERLQEAEINRDVQIRMSKAQLKKHLANQKDLERRLTLLAKRALALNDDNRFRQAGRQLLWTRQEIQRWESYLLSLEILETRRDQAKASVELLQAIKAMSDSLADLTAPEQTAEMQQELAQGLARAGNMEERMSVMVEAIDSTLASETVTDDGALGKLEENLTDEIAREEAGTFNQEIEAGLSKIREELGK